MDGLNGFAREFARQQSKLRFLENALITFPGFAVRPEAINQYNNPTSRATQRDRQILSFKRSFRREIDNLEGEANVSRRF
jgi:hypothetical protein